MTPRLEAPRPLGRLRREGRPRGRLAGPRAGTRRGPPRRERLRQVHAPASVLAGVLRAAGGRCPPRRAGPRVRAAARGRARDRVSPAGFRAAFPDAARATSSSSAGRRTVGTFGAPGPGRPGRGRGRARRDGRDGPRGRGPPRDVGRRAPARPPRARPRGRARPSSSSTSRPRTSTRATASSSSTRCGAAPRAGGTVLFSTHELDVAVRRAPTTRFSSRRGRVLAEGPVAATLTEPLLSELFAVVGVA